MPKLWTKKALFNNALFKNFKKLLSDFKSAPPNLSNWKT